MNQRILTFLRGTATACALALASSLAQAQLSIEITGAGTNRMPVAIASFEGEQTLPRAVTDVVRADLERSGLFKMVELGPSPMGADAPPDFGRVRSRGADAFAVGTVARPAVAATRCSSASSMPPSRSAWAVRPW